VSKQVRIQDLKWDTLPGGTLVSVVSLWGSGDEAENPTPKKPPFQGPCTVEYRLIEGRVTATPGAFVPRTAGEGISGG